MDDNSYSCLGVYDRILFFRRMDWKIMTRHNWRKIWRELDKWIAKNIFKSMALVEKKKQKFYRDNVERIVEKNTK